MNDAQGQERCAAKPVNGSRGACGECGGHLDWYECDQCGGEGVFGHDCGEDVCCCRSPVDNDPCEVCNGAGGWVFCEDCTPWVPKDPHSKASDE